MNKSLYKRVSDIYAGAIGHEFKEDHDYLGAQELANIITAIGNVFDPDNKASIFYSKWNIAEFESPTKATKMVEYIINQYKEEK